MALGASNPISEIALLWCCHPAKEGITGQEKARKVIAIRHSTPFLTLSLAANGIRITCEMSAATSID